MFNPWGVVELQFMIKYKTSFKIMFIKGFQDKGENADIIKSYKIN